MSDEKHSANDTQAQEGDSTNKPSQSEDSRPVTTTGASKAALVRSQRLSPERRTEIARKAARTRWEGGGEFDGIPSEEFTGDLVIGPIHLECAVLSNRERVFSERAIYRLFGTRTGGTRTQRKLASTPEDGYLPPVLAARNLAPFIPESLRVALSVPIDYRAKHGGRLALGTRAVLLPEMCRVLLDARRANKLLDRQEGLAQQAELITSALAQVGIIALVDEATGYQEVRERDELRRILEAYVSKELLGWTRRFPPEFYKELFRLRGWEWIQGSTKRPMRIGKDTDYIIYDRLPPGVKDELKRSNPKVRPGYRRYKNFQFLTTEVGNPHLERLIIAATALMRAATTWGKFKGLLERAIPVSTLQMSLSEVDASFSVPPSEEEDGE